MRTLTRLAASVAAAAGLAAFSAGAAAADSSSTQAAFPVATKICNEVAHGAGPRDVRPVAAKLLADCASLQSGYETAQAAYIAAKAPLRTALKTAIAAKPCSRTAAAPACAQARLQNKQTQKALYAQLRALARSHEAAVKSLRSTFWTAYKALQAEGAALLRAGHTHA